MKLLVNFRTTELKGRVIVDVRFSKPALKGENYTEVGCELFRKICDLVHKLNEETKKAGIDARIIDHLYRPSEKSAKYVAELTVILFKKDREDFLYQKIPQEAEKLGLVLRRRNVVHNVL